MKLDEIAERIDRHLKRLESDEAINVPKPGSRLKPYYRAGACRAGSYVHVVYVSFQGGRNLKKSDAEEYLRWLDAGNVGRHYTALSFNERVKQTPEAKS